MPYEDTERPHNLERSDHEEEELNDFLALFMKKLDQTRHRPRRSWKDNWMLFRKGFRKFSQCYRWKRKYFRVSCVSCNVHFVIKKEQAVPVLMDEWEDVSEGGEDLEDGRIPIGGSDTATSLGNWSEASETISQAADPPMTETRRFAASSEGLCQGCQALSNTPNYETLPSNVAQEDHVPHLTTLAEVSIPVDSKLAVCPLYPGIGNIPTLEEAIRRQQLIANEDSEPRRRRIYMEYLPRTIREIFYSLRLTIIFIFMMPVAPFWAICRLLSMLLLDLDRLFGRLLELFDAITFKLFRFMIHSIIDFSPKKIFWHIVEFLVGFMKTLFMMVFRFFGLTIGGIVLGISAGLQLLSDCIYFLRKCTFPNTTGNRLS